MIFLGGIHGVGKSFFCDEIQKEYGIKSFSASGLIADYKNSAVCSNKRVENIENNQAILLKALSFLKEIEKEFILDGHFCLLNKWGDVERIDFALFERLDITAIILLTESPKIIMERRFNRDNTICKETDIGKFQEEEITYALEVAKSLETPIFICKDSSDMENAMEFANKIYMGGSL